jgi:hypothetical protein
MSTQREALQQALEALEGWDNYEKWVWPESALEQAKRNTTESLAALRAALAEHTPKQEVQEPVAWAYQWKQGQPLSWYVTVARWHESDMWHEYPLYTTPRQAAPEQKPKRTVTYVCPVCAASLEKQE